MVYVPAIEKAKKIVSQDRVFLVGERNRYIYYVVRGDTDTYEVTYDSDKQGWNCTCKNIRMKDCSHILASKILGEKIEQESNSTR